MNESKIITTTLEEILAKPLDVKELQRLADDDSPIDYSDIPEFSDEFMQAACAERERRRKQSVSIRIEPDIIEFFKHNSVHYQSGINAVLRSYVDTVRRRTAG